MKGVWLTDDHTTSVDGRLGYFRLLEHLDYLDNRGDKWRTPKGTISDLSSFPWFVRMFVPKSLLVKSPFFHDYLYEKQPKDPNTKSRVTRKRADQLYRDSAVVEGLSRKRAKLFYAGLRSFGWIAWRSHRKH